MNKYHHCVGGGIDQLFLCQFMFFLAHKYSGIDVIHKCDYEDYNIALLLWVDLMHGFRVFDNYYTVWFLFPRFGGKFCPSFFCFATL
jgi:hypothetical protein